MTIRNFTGFAGARDKALSGVPDALATSATGPHRTPLAELLASRRQLN